MVANFQAVPRMKHTLQEYYAMLEASDKRWEYWDGEFVCMAGGSPEHAKITSRVTISLGTQLEGRDCEVLGPDMAIKTPSLPPFRYPDLSVTCSDPRFEKVDRFHTLANPIVLIEVLSTSTEHADREPKRLAYQALSSVQEYLLIAQSLPYVTHFVRQGEKWVRFDYDDLNHVVELSSIQCTLPLRTIYRGIKFE